MRPYAYNYGAWEAEEGAYREFETILEDTVQLWTAWTSEWDRVSVNKQASRQANKITRPLGLPVRSSFLPVELSFLWRRIVSEPAGESREICTSWQDSKDPEGRNDFLKAIVPGPLSYGICVELSAHMSWVPMRWVTQREFERLFLVWRDAFRNQWGEANLQGILNG